MSSLDWLLAAATILFPVLSAVAVWAVRVNKGTEAAEAAKKALDTAEQARSELSDYKVHVAETYVSHANMVEVERRLSDQIKAVGDRLERLFHPTPPGR